VERHHQWFPRWRHARLPRCVTSSCPEVDTVCCPTFRATDPPCIAPPPASSAEGPKRAAIGAVTCGILLGVIEGAGFLVSKLFFADMTRPQMPQSTSSGLRPVCSMVGSVSRRRR
jgi:hypothetical protein